MKTSAIYRNGVLLGWGLLAWLACGEALASEVDGETKRTPSVLFILVDDLGYNDIGANNPRTFYETPHIDGLAASGMRFTNGYAANPVCSPTRFSIQTGRYPSRVDATNFFSGRREGRFGPAPLHDRMDPEEVTLAEALKERQYATFFAGKWHLGPEETDWPEYQGYDVNRGGWRTGGPWYGSKYFSPYGNPRLEDGPEGEHLPDRLATEACEFMAAHRDEPFLAFLSFYSVHTPLIGRPDLVAKYEVKAREILGEEFGAEERVWPEGEAPRSVRILQKHAVYAAMVEAMDAAVGKTLRQIDALGLRDDVIVCFTSDNGGLSTSEGSPTSNLPLRGGKGWLYEGGIREPFIVRWPGVTPPGSVNETPVMSVDFYPTLVRAAGGTPKGVGPIDGVDLKPLLLGRENLERDALFWHYPHYSNQGGFPGGAIRMGPWKLIERYETGRVHLFHLGDDVGERTDLSAAYPERVALMRARLHSWYRDVDAKFLTPIAPDDAAPWRP